MVLDYFWPLQPLPLLPTGIQYAVGFTLLFGWVLKAFSKSKTSIDHRKPTLEIISSGSFRLSRNPVYVSMTVLLIGLAIAVDRVWVVAMVVPAVWVTHHFVILREEVYLEINFGDEYLRYKEEIRRWI